MSDTYTIAGREYPVTEYVTTQKIGRVLLVDLPMMSDERWNELSQENAVHNFTRKFGRPPKTVEEAVEWQHEYVTQSICRMEAVS